MEEERIAQAESAAHLLEIRVLPDVCPRAEPVQLPVDEEQMSLMLAVHVNVATSSLLLRRARVLVVREERAELFPERIATHQPGLRSESLCSHTHLSVLRSSIEDCLRSSACRSTLCSRDVRLVSPVQPRRRGGVELTTLAASLASSWQPRGRASGPLRSRRSLPVPGSCRGR